MTRLLVFQHAAGEHPGRLAELWKADGISWDVVALDGGEKIPGQLDRYDGLVVLGGPMDVWEEMSFPWLGPEKRAIRAFVAGLHRPYLGLCLGHQLLADALGGRVVPAGRAEIGIAPVELNADGRADAFFDGVPERFDTLHWHAAEVRALPSHAVPLAASEHCAIQAFRWRNHAYGLQFHPEVTEDSVTEFQHTAADRAYVEARLGVGASERLAREIRAAMAGLDVVARRLHRNFCRLLGLSGTQGT